MTPDVFLRDALDPGLELLASVSTIKPSPQARLMLLAIAGQESHWQYRRQIGGPARSYWQFERGGGVAGLLRVMPNQLAAVCRELDIPYDAGVIFEAMAWNDRLAAAMARLLLWTLPQALPAIDDPAEGWRQYLDAWRPGLPHPETWAARWAASRKVLAV